MTATALETWRAGATRRWHSNRDMSDAVDTVDAHSARMARLAIELFWPEYDTSALVVACLYHDLAEAVVGDAPLAAKAMLPAFRTMEAAVDADKGWIVPLAIEDQARLKLLDRLDAYLMMLHHKPRLRKRGDWRADHADLLAMADGLGVGGEVRDMIREARG